MNSSNVKVCALHASQALRISKFWTSNSWPQNFLRCSGVQSSFNLLGKGFSEIHASTSSRMEEIRNTLLTYEISNISNIDESGIFYHIRPSRTYLSLKEVRREIRSTMMLRHKNRVTVVLCMNGDGSHTIPVTFVEHYKSPIALKQSQFA